jgi:hypothetical protein
MSFPAGERLKRRSHNQQDLALLQVAVSLRAARRLKEIVAASNLLVFVVVARSFRVVRRLKDAAGPDRGIPCWRCNTLSRGQAIESSLIAALLDQVFSSCNTLSRGQAIESRARSRIVRRRRQLP